MRTRPSARPGAAKTRTDPVRRGGSAAPDGGELLYGRNAVRESLRAGRRRHRRLLVSDASETHQRVEEIARLAATLEVQVETIQRQRLDALISGHHQGVALETSLYPYADDLDLAALAAEGGALLVLDELVDPQNVGTLLRTAEVTGVSAVVIPTDRAAAITPAVVNASAGAVEHLVVRREVNLTRWLHRAKDAGFWAVGLAGDGDAQPLFEVNMRPPVVVVVGAEGAGLRRLVRETCDIVAAIPMSGRIESLNAAVAGSIALYEIVRDR